MDRWAGKVALVTGACSGIGTQICRDLCGHEVWVFGLDRDSDRIQLIFDEILASGAQFSAITCDLTEEEQIVFAFDRVIEEAQGVDILINCAGMMTNNAILDEEGYETILKTF